MTYLACFSISVYYLLMTLKSTIIKSEDDACKLQQDVVKLGKWSEMWQIPFNVSKCRSLHMGRTITPIMCIAV